MAYQGHRNWNHWNVSLWINNDEGLYSLARAIKRGYNGDRKAQALGMLAVLKERGITHTPDGAPYSMTSLMAAMHDI